MSLKKFIEQRNVFNKMFNYPVLDINDLSHEDYQSLANDIGMALSPENLTCDGELRGAKLQAKAKMLHKAQAELEALGYEVEY